MLMILRSTVRLLLCLLSLSLLETTLLAQESGTIFVVRHAEKQSDAQDTPLSAKGQARAECLAQTLKDAHVTAVFTSQFQRTKQTAAAVVRDAKANEEAFEAKNYEQFVTAAKAASKTGNVLIVGHSNTVPDLVQKLGGPAVTVADTSYDQLFLVDAEHPQHTITLHYCTALPTDDTKHPPNSMAK